MRRQPGCTDGGDQPGRVDLGDRDPALVDDKHLRRSNGHRTGGEVVEANDVTDGGGSLICEHAEGEVVVGQQGGDHRCRAGVGAR